MRQRHEQRRRSAGCTSALPSSTAPGSRLRTTSMAASSVCASTGGSFCCSASASARCADFHRGIQLAVARWPRARASRCASHLLRILAPAAAAIWRSHVAVELLGHEPRHRQACAHDRACRSAAPPGTASPRRRTGWHPGTCGPSARAGSAGAARRPRRARKSHWHCAGRPAPRPLRRASAARHAAQQRPQAGARGLDAVRDAAAHRICAALRGAPAS